MNLLLTFTDNVSLQIWFESGIINREISVYKKLLEKNVNISFLTYGSRKDLEYSNILGDIKVLPCSNLIKSRILKIQFFKKLLLPIKLKKMFRNIDIIKTNQLNGSWVACIAKLFYRKKLVIRGGYEWLKRHINEISYKKKGFILYIKYLSKLSWIFIFELIAYKLADGIILPNKKDVSYIVKTFKLKRKAKRNRILNLYNFVDVDMFKPMDAPKRDKRILFIGRFIEQKNLFNLLKAIRDLKQFGLTIIGEGPIQNKLNEKVEEYGIDVDFLGTVPHHEIPKIMAQHDIFIIPSYAEGNPKVLLEAMSAGLACIGTNTHGINDIITHKENGYLCGTTVKSIKEAILSVYNNNDLKKKISRNARAFATKNFSINNITKREYSFYKEILR